MSDSDAGSDSLEGSDDDGLLECDDDGNMVMLDSMATGNMQFLSPHGLHNACFYDTEMLWHIQTVKMIVQTMIQRLMMKIWYTISVEEKVQVMLYMFDLSVI